MYEKGPAPGANRAVAAPAVRMSTSGWALLTGDCGVGAVAFNVEPSFAASATPGSAPVGATGAGESFEQASASARTAPDAQAKSLVCCISNLVELWNGTRWERAAKYYYTAAGSVIGCVLP